MELGRIGIQSDRDPYDNHTIPMTNLHPLGGAELILGQLRPPQGYQQPPGRTPVLKPSSNSSLAIVSITGSTTSSSFWTKLDIRGYSNHLSIPINQYLPQFSLWTPSGFFQAKFYRKSLSHFSVRKDILSILGNINSGAFRMSCFLQQLQIHMK